MGKVFFISDAHIGAESPERERMKQDKLSQFFNIVAEEAVALYILGDFFDFWFDYRKTIFCEHFDALCALTAIADKGIDIHIFGGNHDWWIGKKGYLSKRLSARTYDKPTLCEIMEKKLFIGHGDGIAPSDWGYRNILCPILRNPVSIWLFGLLPAEWGLALAKMASSSSRLYNEKRNFKLEREYEEFAHKKLQDGADYVIFGHLHLPIMKEYDCGTYVNIGDFFRNFSYAVFDGEKISLRQIE